jgi:hypothetical protein
VRKNIIILIFLFVTFLVADESFAGKNIFIELEVADIQQTVKPDAQRFFIGSVVDKRFFGGLSSPTNVPSWGVAKPEQTDELKSKAVGRAVQRGERKEGNILIGKGDVRSIMKDVVSGAMKQLGYSEVTNRNVTGPDTIIVDIEINKFWGYFHEAFIGGSINVSIEAAMLLNKKDKIEKKTIQVSGKRSARYPQKPANWEKVFNEALSDFENSTLVELRPESN